MFRTCIALCSLMVAASGFSHSLAAQTPDWEKECQEDRCTLTRGVVDAESGRRVATMLVVVPTAQDGESLAGIALSLGAALEPGVRFVLGEGHIDIPFTVCLPDGCRATKVLSEAELQALSAADVADVRFFAYSNGTQISVDVPLDGLAEQISSIKG